MHVSSSDETNDQAMHACLILFASPSFSAVPQLGLGPLSFKHLRHPPRPARRYPETTKLLSFNEIVGMERVSEADAAALRSAFAAMHAGKPTSSTTAKRGTAAISVKREGLAVKREGVAVKREANGSEATPAAAAAGAGQSGSAPDDRRRRRRFLRTKPRVSCVRPRANCSYVSGAGCYSSENSAASPRQGL